MRDDSLETGWRFHMAAERPVVTAAILGFSGFTVHFVHASWSDPVLTATAIGLLAASLWKWFLPVTIKADSSGFSKATAAGSSRVDWSGVDGISLDGATVVVMVRAKTPIGPGAAILNRGAGGTFEIMVPPTREAAEAFIALARAAGVKVTQAGSGPARGDDGETDSGVETGTGT